MGTKVQLGAKAQNAILASVDRLFERAKQRFLGPRALGKVLVFNFNKDHSLTGLFEAANKQEGVAPREEVLESVLNVAGSYLDAHKERTKARVLREVQTFIHDAQTAGRKVDPQVVIEGKLSEVWSDVKKDVKTIVETESTIVRNTGLYDAIGRVGAMAGSSDPTIFFITVRDRYCCEECKRIHLLPDGITPRVWKMSEVEAGYHRRGVDAPSIGGLHPNCRCVLTHLMPGYSFTAAGRVTFKTLGWDEYKHQRGLDDTPLATSEPV